MEKAVFLDRDGVLTEEVDYLSDVSQLRFIPDSARAVHLLNATEMKVIIITNQSGVARGYFSEMVISEIHQEMKKQLSAEKAFIDAVYYCPHHPEGAVEQYAIKCDCRKPGLGMLTQATEDYGIDLKHSYLVGDKLSDVECAQKAGMSGILVLTGYGKEARKMIADGSSVRPIYIARNLYEAAQWIIEDYGSGNRGDTYR
jgi:D-glycero-D-manno-heptose 1,7-bisphosphate phosphatase